MGTITIIFLVLGFVVILSDIVIPSGGFLTASGITLIITGGWNYIGLNWVWQLILFIPTLILSFLICYKVMAVGGSFIERKFLPDKIKTNFQGLVGKKGTVYSLESGSNKVRVNVNGDIWICSSDESLKIGDVITVTNIIDDELIIKKE